MKKILTLTLGAVMLICTLVACGGKNNSNISNNNNDSYNSKDSNSDNSNKSTTKSEDKTSSTNHEEITDTPAATDTKKIDSPFDEVSVVFSGDKITVTYEGNASAGVLANLKSNTYAYMKLYFTYEEDNTMDTAGAFLLETYGDGEVSSVIEIGDYKLKKGEVTFDEKGSQMTCVFTGKEEEVSSMFTSLDMKGKVKLNDTTGVSSYVSYVKDAVTQE